MWCGFKQPNMILLMEWQPQHLLTHTKQTTLIGGRTRKSDLTASAPSQSGNGGGEITARSAEMHWEHKTEVWTNRWTLKRINLITFDRAHNSMPLDNSKQSCCHCIHRVHWAARLQSNCLATVCTGSWQRSHCRLKTNQLWRYEIKFKGKVVGKNDFWSYLYFRDIFIA